MVLGGSVGDGCAVHLSYSVMTEECSVKDGDYREGRQLLPGFVVTLQNTFLEHNETKRLLISKKEKGKLGVAGST